MRGRSYAPLLLIAWLAIACNQSSIRHVPRLNAATLNAPQSPGLAPRSLMLRVEDERREDLREHSTEVVARVDEAVRAILKRVSVAVGDGANVLTIRVHEPERGLVGGPPQRCVALDGRLDIAGRGWAEAQASTFRAVHQDRTATCSRTHRDSSISVTSPR